MQIRHTLQADEAEMQSIFSKIYPYRQKEAKNNLENYLIEIFAFCLDNDACFRNRFLQQLDLADENPINIATQRSYDGFGRPDIEIDLPSARVIIECKVESTERADQLQDYARLLKESTQKRRILIYLTKYYEAKSVNEEGAFRNIKWCDIDALIDDSCGPITNQLKTFLKEYEVAMDNNFNNIDLVCLENIPATIAKMDEVIDSVSGYFAEEFGPLSKYSSRSTRLRESGYYNNRVFGDPGKFSIDVGFLWWGEDDGCIYLTIGVWIPSKDDSSREVIEFFKTNLKDWKPEDWDDAVYISTYKSLQEIIVQEKDHVPAMSVFLKEGIAELAELKRLDGGLFE